VVRAVLRVFLGLFGGLWFGIIAVVMSWSATESRPTPDGAVLVCAFAIGAVAVGAAAFLRTPFLRVPAWAAGGAGFGFVLDALLAGGLGAGDTLTPSAVVLALVGAVIGYRTVPPVRPPGGAS